MRVCNSCARILFVVSLVPSAVVLQPSKALSQIPAQRQLRPFPFPSAPASPEGPAIEPRPEPSRPATQPATPRPETAPAPLPVEVQPSRPVAPRPQVVRPPAPVAESPRLRSSEDPRAQQDKVPKLLVSIRTDKAIYKNGERVKLIGKVVNLTGDFAVASVVDLRVFRKVRPEQKEGAPGREADSKKEVVYRTLLEPKSADFSDDGYVIQFPTDDTLLALLFTKQVEFEVGADVTARGSGEGSLAVASFAAEEIGYVNLFGFLLVFIGAIFYVLLLISWVFMKEPSKAAARTMLFAIYGSGLFFLLVALGGPLLISLSPTLEALLRTTPVGLVKGTTERIKDLQWMVNIGGVLGSDNILKGGYSVPLFLLVLGVMGGVISMLLKLPDFLHEYDAIESGSTQESVEVSNLRAKVFRYFVFIVTGPFLGMIVYSLAVLADYTNALALSIMAFSVGFISDRIVETMLSVSENVLTRAKGLFKGGAGGQTGRT